MKKILTLFFAVILFPFLALAQPVSQTFNASGTWTCPVGYSASITVQCWGGGGGGTNASGRAGGGGGGAYASSTFNVVAGSYIITVGGGGAVGSAGGNSSFSSTVVAVGGGSSASTSSTTFGVGGSAATSTGDTKFSGGNGGVPGSGTNGGGGGGGSATMSADGLPGAASSGGIGGDGGIGEGNGGKGANTSGANPAVAGSIPGGGGGGRASTTNVTSAAGASGRVIVTVNSFALPIELTTFTLNSTLKDVNLIWQTATEKNNAFFAIERSSDGRAYTQIGEVKGAGTSLIQQDYTYTDEKPLRGINFYRLKQVDFDGQFSYSPVVSVVFGKVGNVVLYPTPTTSTMNVRLEEAFQTEANWQVIDLVGRIVTEGVFPAEQTDTQIPVGTLSEGNYVLRVTAGQEVITQKFRKIEK